MRLSFKLLATTAALSFMASTANAATNLKFVLTGDLEATWTLPASPVPDEAGSFGFRFFGLQGTWGGIDGVRRVTFFDAPLAGALSIRKDAGALFDFTSRGDVLFTGTSAAPTFRTGTFALTRLLTDVPGNGTLTISALGVIPEPATWAMLIAGFGLVGMTARRRREVVAG